MSPLTNVDIRHQEDEAGTELPGDGIEFATFRGEAYVESIMISRKRATEIRDELSRLLDTPPAKERARWRCPCCRSLNVQISLPTWYYETTDHDLIFAETDSDADISWWYCEDCNESDSGQPEDALDDEPAEVQP